MTSSKNIEFKKNSFLNKSNSAFIEEMYVKYIEKDPNLPESWKNYFSDLDDDIQSVIKEVEGPSWAQNCKGTGSTPAEYWRGIAFRRYPVGVQRNTFLGVCRWQRNTLVDISFAHSH